MLKQLLLPLFCLICVFAGHAQSVKQYQDQIDSLGKIEDFEHVIPLAEQMRTVARDSFGAQSIEYYRAITRLGYAYGRLSRFNDAYPLRLEAKDLIEKLKGKKFIGYATACFNLSVLDSYQSHFESAKRYMVEALDVYHQLFGEEDIHLVQPMIQLGIFDFNLGNYASALSYIEKSRVLLIKLKQSDTPEFSDVLINLGASQFALDQMGQSEQLFRAALALKYRLHTPDTTYAQYLLAKTLIRSDKLDEAEPILLQIIQLDEGKNDVARSKVLAMQELARLNGLLGRLPEAENLLRKSIEIEVSVAGNQTFQYALGLNQLSECLRMQGKFDEALRYALEVCALKAKIFGKTEISFVVSLIELADCYAALKQWDQAETTYLEALSILPQINAYTGDRLTDIQASLGDLYFVSGKRAQSRKSYQEALATMAANNYSSFSKQYARVNMELGILANSDAEKEAAQTYFSVYEKAQNEWLLRMLPSLSDVQKMQFLAEFKGELADLYSFQFREKSQSYSDLLLSRQLIYKNLATSSLKNLIHTLESTEDTLARADFENWRGIRAHIANLYTLSKTELAQQPDSIPDLENKAAILEKSLARRSTQFAEYNKPQPVYSWKDLRAALHPGEVAVDIARLDYHQFGGGATDTCLYAFLIVSPGTQDQPALVFLPNGNELESILIEQYRAEVQNKKPDAKISDALYNAFWKPIEPFLAGAQRVFVASDGVYNKINLQTLRRPDGKYLLETYDIKSVSNLKDMLDKQAQPTPSSTSKTAFLLGNPAFNLSGEPADSAVIPATLRSVYRDLAEDRNIKLSPLPGSEKEVKNIAGLFQKYGWTVSTSVGKNADESSVKKAQSPRVMHLATHGYFLENEHKSAQTIGIQSQYVSRNPMLRSMLFFAGAQNTLDHLPGPRLEDGILTAYEAQNLNLENTDLLVLSACNTGLGKIENGEGVMGLQRAFQVAGAKTIIMSLWNVDDAVTQLLMSTFYENWLSGKSKATAFQLAQQRVKATYPQPFFWGAFVMMGRGGE